MKKTTPKVKKTESLLHIQDIAHSRKKGAKTLLRVLVWVLILAFVSTLGVTWGGAASNYGNIVTTKGIKIDLSPSGFFLRERETVSAQMAENNPEADPRVLNTFINETSLRRSEALALRYNFIKEIGIEPSPMAAEALRRNPITSSPQAAQYYYGGQNLMSPLGVYRILSQPSVSDIYAINDISRLEIAAEALMLSATNFYGAQITLEEKEDFYRTHASTWADRLVASVFTADSRSNAFELAKVLTNAPTALEGLSNALQLLGIKENRVVAEQKAAPGDARWSKSTYTSQDLILPQGASYELFTAGVTAFSAKPKNYEAAVSAPVYSKGQYKILFISSIGSYEALTPLLQKMMSTEMAAARYKDLEKTHKSAYEAALASLKAELAAGTAFGAIAAKIPGLVADASEAFSPLHSAAASIQGAEFAAPVLKDARLLRALLFAPDKPELFAAKGSKDTYYAVRPLSVRAPNPEELAIDIQAAFANGQNLQNIFAYRSTQLDDALSLGLAKRYKLQSNPTLLTNFRAR